MDAETPLGEKRSWLSGTIVPWVGILESPGGNFDEM